jgi:cation transporter-like permease
VHCSCAAVDVVPPASAAARKGTHDWESVMVLIAYYVVFMIVGDLAAYVIGLVAEKEFGGQVSLIVFLALYFLFLWVSWLLAVWVTQPKQAAATT